MKVRVGFGLGTRTSATDDPSRFASLVDALEDRGFDSLWLSERMAGPGSDPLVGLAFAAGRTQRLKLGTSVQVLPGRNPASVAKAWASLDRLSAGRALPAFGLGVRDPKEQQAFGVDRAERGPWFDEALPLIRRLWTEESVDHDGDRFHLQGVTIRPKPVQDPLEVWLGGLAPAELRRVGRLGDGWLPSFCTVDEAAAGRSVIEEAAAGGGRSVDAEHWGALVIYTDGPVPPALADLVAARRPGVDPGEILVAGIQHLAARLEAFLDRGFSKFVVVPAGDPGDWTSHLDDVAGAVVGLQT